MVQPYLDSSSRDDRLSGGSHRIPIDTPLGRFEVWTKRVGNNPSLRLLLLHGGPGCTHEYFEAADSWLPAAGVEYYYYDQLGSGRSDIPTDESLWDLPRFVDEVEQVRLALGLDRDSFVPADLRPDQGPRLGLGPRRHHRHARRVGDTDRTVCPSLPEEQQPAYPAGAVSIDEFQRGFHHRRLLLDQLRRHAAVDCALGRGHVGLVGAGGGTGHCARATDGAFHGLRGGRPGSSPGTDRLWSSPAAAWPSVPAWPGGRRPSGCTPIRSRASSPG
jgi:hypothetical protein